MIKNSYYNKPIWNNFLDSERKKRVTNKIVEIIEIIEETNDFPRRYSPMTGELGTILFLFYSSKVFKKEIYYELAFKRLTNFLETVSDNIESNTLCNGLVGICWYISHLSKDFIANEKFESLIENGIDEYLSGLVKEWPNENFVDLLHGGLGVAVYFAERDESKYLRFLEIFLEKLSNLSLYDKKADGIKWESNINGFSTMRGVNIGTAHGIAGVISMLRILVAKKVNLEKTDFLLSNAIRYLNAQRIEDNEAISIYPNWIIENEKPSQSRLGWCYGDLSIGLILYYTALQTNNPELANYSEEILIQTTNRKSKEQSLVMDAGLCHGSSGIALMYNRLYNTNNNQLFKDAAIFWLDKTIELSQFNDGLAGYKSFEYNEYVIQYGLMSGISGIGLSLLSFISDEEPSWDRCLLIS